MNAFSLYRQDSGSGNFPPPPPPPPGNPQYGYNPPTPPSGNQGGSASSNAIISLVLGILSYIMCPVILGIAAWIMGNNELKAIDSGRSPEAGRMLANIGKWLGIVNIILTVIGVIVFIILMSLGVITSMFNN